MSLGWVSCWNYHWNGSPQRLCCCQIQITGAKKHIFRSFKKLLLNSLFKYRFSLWSWSCTLIVSRRNPITRLQLKFIFLQALSIPSEYPCNNSTLHTYSTFHPRNSNGCYKHPGTHPVLPAAVRASPAAHLLTRRVKRALICGVRHSAWPCTMRWKTETPANKTEAVGVHAISDLQNKSCQPVFMKMICFATQPSFWACLCISRTVTDPSYSAHTPGWPDTKQLWSGIN